MCRARLVADIPLPDKFSDLSELDLCPPKVTIGRSLFNTYVFPHICISRQHCHFETNGNNLWFIVDISSGGIFINNSPIPQSTKHPVKHGDIIKFGENFEYKFENHDDSSCSIDNTHQSQIENSFSILGNEKCIEVLPLDKKLNDVFNTHSVKDAYEVENKVFESRIEALTESRNELIENFNKEREVFERQIEEITTISNNKVADLNNKLHQQKIDFIKEKEILEIKLAETDKILQENTKQLSEYKNSCFTLETEIKEYKEKLTSNLADIEMNVNNKKMLKRLHDDMEMSERPSTQCTNLLDAELVCMICYEYIIEATTLNCSHTFCSYCITSWKKRSSECPMCRVSIHFEVHNRLADSVIDNIFMHFGESYKRRREQLIDSRKKRKEVKKKPRKSTREQTTLNNNNLLSDENAHDDRQVAASSENPTLNQTRMTLTVPVSNRPELRSRNTRSYSTRSRRN